MVAKMKECSDCESSGYGLRDYSCRCCWRGGPASALCYYKCERCDGNGEVVDEQWMLEFGDGHEFFDVMEQSK